MPLIDLTSLGNVVFDGKEVQVLQLNGVEIWTASKPDEYILNVSSVYVDGYEGTQFTGVKFLVTVGEGGGSATFNGETITLDSTSTSVEFLTASAGVTGDIKFKGDFSKITPASLSVTTARSEALVNINSIKLLYGNWTGLIDSQFQWVTIDFDVTIPDTYTEINMNAFGASQYQDFFGTGNLYFGNNVKQITGVQNYAYYQNFFANGLNTGQLWHLNGCVFATSIQASNLVNVTIPSGTRLLATSLFEQGVFDHSGYLETITFPNENLIKEIPKLFCKSASKLTTINIPNSVEIIESEAFNGCTALLDFTVPANVSKIGNLAFASIKESIRFMQPAGMEVSLPTAGTNGMCYVKSATSLTIYTDNETIKNYNYSADNITATIYHLDGSAWA